VLRQDADANIPGCHADRKGEDDRCLTTLNVKPIAQPGTVRQIEYQLIQIRRPDSDSDIGKFVGFGVGDRTKSEGMPLFFLLDFDSVMTPLGWCVWQIPARRVQRRVGALRNHRCRLFQA
jgi:hypothetical protein